MRFQFKRVAIVNRGEPAIRLIHAVREINAEHRCGLRTIAMYTDPDRDSMFVREADEAICLGPATFLDPADNSSKSSYLDPERVERALLDSNAEAVWVGWGFVAERPEFADMVQSLGLVFVGPSGDVMRLMGDKIASKRLAEEAQVPVADWSGGPVNTIEEAIEHAERLEYPVLIKATAGGGGRGIRKVHSSDQLAASFESARSEALKAFGDGTVFVEKMVLNARHVEVQILADLHGECWAVGVRDCTIQRRNQKVLEEAPSPVLAPALDEALRVAAVRLAKRAGYQNAGTAEFLFDPVRESFFFMEMNTRLQVEHPVTEITTGLDLVKHQLLVAEGYHLEGDSPATSGHAIEVRINAEDPDNGFAPAPGPIELLRLPTGPGLRIDTGVAQGDTVPSDFDSMIAKLIAYGKTREEALSRLQCALSELVVVIDGGRTNKAFLLEMLAHDDVHASRIDIGWLDRTWGDQGNILRPNADIALAQAAVEMYERATALDEQAFLVSASRGRVETKKDRSMTVELGHAGENYRFNVRCVGPERYRLEVDGVRFDVEVARQSRFERRLWCGGDSYKIVISQQGTSFLIEVAGVLHRISSDESGTITAPSPGVVLEVHVKPGDVVAAGDGLILMEAMKMETVVSAPFAGKVREIAVSPGIHVAAGTPLLMLEPAGEESDQVATERVVFQDRSDDLPATPLDPDALCQHGRRVLAELRNFVLGYEVPEQDLAQMLERWLNPLGNNGRSDRGRGTQVTPWHVLLNDGNTSSESSPDSSRLPAATGALEGGEPAPQPARDQAFELMRQEEEVLRIFADIINLFERRPHSTVEQGLSRPECMLAFLQSMDPEEERLPPQFVDKLENMLAHYGIRSLRRCPSLTNALLWLHKAFMNIRRARKTLLRLLEARIEAVDVLLPHVGHSFQRVLHHLADATQDNFPAINEFARLLAYRHFEVQRLERAQARVYDIMTNRLSQLAASPESALHEQEMTTLAALPLPLGHFLANKLTKSEGRMRTLYFEVLVRRMYPVQKVHSVRSASQDGWPIDVAEFTLNGRRHRTLATYARREEIPRVLECVRDFVATAPPFPGSDRDGGKGLSMTEKKGADTRKNHRDTRLLVDYMLAEWPEPIDDPVAVSKTLSRSLDAVDFTTAPHRIAFNLLTGRDRRAIHYFTFTPDAAGNYQEVIQYRGIQPALADRLELWRLDNFDLTRLPAAEDCYLFYGVARSTPGDKRLFALVEVLHISRRDESGDVRVPHLERRILQAIDGMRDFMYRNPDLLLDWNRITLFITPPMDMTLEELELFLPEIAHRLAILTTHVGVDRIAVHAWVVDPGTGDRIDKVMHMTLQKGSILRLRISDPGHYPIGQLTPYHKNVLKMRRRGLIYPYEIIKMMTPRMGGSLALFPPGEFSEHDLAESGDLKPVLRPYGQNKANVVVGVIKNFTSKHPEGMSRVMILGDPSRGMGSLAEPECIRIIKALELAESMQVPVEWFAVSSGARISMDSGTENLDWTARVLRKIIEFTQAGWEINVVVDGVNVGAQSYWDAEATMLMHTRGILIMTSKGAMVMTGKRALEYSGSVSAEDNLGIGGVERIMGPNAQAQFVAPDIADACDLMFQYYEFTYRAPGERYPRPGFTSDPRERDISFNAIDAAAREGTDFETVGEIFSPTRNPGRKKPFSIRPVMRAVIDADREPLERWALMRNAETAVTWEAQLGGHPICLIGIESRNVQRLGYVPADGPDGWSGGTLYPLSSKKVARAINAASGNRPVVVLANLSGFDGSPESMRRLQLEYGAEIGRAVVNFKGPFVFCVISRYHGGAYVVFSRTLNENLEVLALEGSFASVIGGAPAAAVVFPKDVKNRTRADPRVKSLQERIAAADKDDKARLTAELAELFASIHAEKLNEVADEFERVHSVQRAKEVGSLHDIIPPNSLRPYLIDALERGMKRDQDTAHRGTDDKTMALRPTTEP